MQSLRTASLSERAQSAIMRLIEQMDLTQDNKLPREEVLAERLGVSRTTIRQALNNLAADGVVMRRQGKGTFVNVDSVGIRVTFSPCMELMQAIRNSGFSPTVRLLDSRIVHDPDEVLEGSRTTADVRAALQLADGDALVQHEKVFFADGRPCAFCRDYFGASVVGGEAELGALASYEDSLFHFVYDRSGRRVEWDKVEIDVTLGRDLPASFDGVLTDALRARPLLCVRAINYDQDSQPVICTAEHIDTSVIRYNLVRRKAVDYGGR